MRRALLLTALVSPIALLGGALIPASAQASRACGQVSARGSSVPLQVAVYKGNASCAEARKVIHALYGGHRGRPYCEHTDSSCRDGRPEDLANTYWIVDGWKCGVGAGGGGCSRGTRNQISGTFVETAEEH
jgi:hypothetical protein